MAHTHCRNYRFQGRHHQQINLWLFFSLTDFTQVSMLGNGTPLFWWIVTRSITIPELVASRNLTNASRNVMEIWVSSSLSHSCSRHAHSSSWHALGVLDTVEAISCHVLYLSTGIHGSSDTFMFFEADLSYSLVQDPVSYGFPATVCTTPAQVCTVPVHFLHLLVLCTQIGCVITPKWRP